MVQMNFIFISSSDPNLLPKKLVKQKKKKKMMALLQNSYIAGPDCILFLGAPRGLGELGRRAINFQGAGEHC